MSSVAPVPEVFQRLFLATDAPMGQTWLLSTRIPLTELALHRQALASKVPSIAKARDAYGHFRTASQMNKVPGRYWKPEPDLERFHPTEFQTLEPSTGAHPHGSFDLFERGSSRWDSLGDTTIRTRWNKDGTLHHRGCRSILGHSRHGGWKPPSRVILVGFLGRYGAHTVWSPSRLHPPLPPHGSSGGRISKSQTTGYRGLHAGYSAPFLPLWGAGRCYCTNNHGVSLSSILSSGSLRPAPRFGLANDNRI
jgi:hypothetical protein